MEKGVVACEDVHKFGSKLTNRNSLTQRLCGVLFVISESHQAGGHVIILS